MPADLGSEYFVRFKGRHLTVEICGRSDPGMPDLRDNVSLNGPEVFELLVEVAGQQQHGVLQLALTAVQRTLAKIAGHDRGADHDCSDQERAANDKPADRAAARRMLEIGRGGTVCRHGS